MELAQPVKKGQAGSIKLQSLSNNAVIKVINLDNEVKMIRRVETRFRPMNTVHTSVLIWELQNCKAKATMF